MLGATRALLPDAPIVYACDPAGLPYGEKTEMEVSARVSALLGLLAERYHPRLIVIACNTASTIALSHVRSMLKTPVVGTVPAIKPAAALSQSRVIGVLGTNATIRQPYVDRLSAEFASDCTVIRHGAPELVDAAERVFRGEAVEASVYEKALAGLFSQPGGYRMDTIVLACTHFPLIADELAKAAPHPVRFIDGSAGIARRIAHLTEGQAWDNSGGDFAVMTGDGPIEESVAKAFARYGFTRVERL